MNQKLIFDKLNTRVVSEDDSEIAFYTDELGCPDEVVENIVKLFNECLENGEQITGSEGKVDLYLLDEVECTQDDRETIIECLNIYLFPEEEKERLKNEEL